MKKIYKVGFSCFKSSFLFFSPCASFFEGEREMTGFSSILKVFMTCMILYAFDSQVCVTTFISILCKKFAVDPIMLSLSVHLEL